MGVMIYAPDCGGCAGGHCQGALFRALKRLYGAFKMRLRVNDGCEELQKGETSKKRLGSSLYDLSLRFITQLLLQGMLMLLESEVVVRCRQSDQTLVQSCLKDAADQYSGIIKQETGASKAFYKEEKM